MKNWQVAFVILVIAFSSWMIGAARAEQQGLKRVEYLVVRSKAADGKYAWDTGDDSIKIGQTVNDRGMLKIVGDDGWILITVKDEPENSLGIKTIDYIFRRGN